jgi:hypothetical protein
MFEPQKTQDRIIDILRTKGPSLPIQISKMMQINSIFASAFLSELLNDKRIRVSNLKVGGSPLYYLEGQEKELEGFYKYLHPKEVEAFLLIKEKKVLKDSELEPAIRVAISSIRDFAGTFKKDEELYWRYRFVTNEEIKEILEPKIAPKIRIDRIKVEKPKFEHRIRTEKPKVERPKLEPKEEIKLERREIPVKIKIPSVKKPEELHEPEFQNPLVVKVQEPIKKEKPKSIFALKIIEFLNRNNLKVIEEKDYKAKEYNCILQIDSELGPINFLTQAKDKKTINDSDVKKLLSSAQSIPLPALILYTGNLSKKASEYIEKYYSILKEKKI